MDRTLYRACVSAYIQLNTPISLSCFLLLAAGEWDQLALKRVSPSTYLDVPSGAARYAKDVQAVDLLRKAPLQTTFDRKVAAEKSFLAAEEQCCRSNLQLSLARDYPFGELEYAMHGIVRRGKKWLARVLGVLPDNLPFGFGPGTTFELKGSSTSAIGDKITMTQCVTQSAWDLSSWAWAKTLPAHSMIVNGRTLLNVCPGNRFTTVPKDGSTDRGICIEPGANLYLQKGVGSYMKQRLGSIGLHVWQQPHRNPDQWFADRPMAVDTHRRLARDGSRTGAWATIDLSNASDTVCRELVRWLLPPDWFKLLDDMRSKRTLFRGQWHVLEKFSSMGNGFTFELETAIFAALIHGVTGLVPGRDFFVFGDDIVVPTEVFSDTFAVLKCFGFTPNEKKTFSQGPFRESCGGDYFIGYEVRPFQIKTLECQLLDLKALHNGFIEKRLYRAARCVADAIPTSHRVYGPTRYGDTVLHGSRRKWKVFKKDGIEWIRPLLPIFHRYPLDRWGDDSVIPQLLLGLSSDGYIARGSIPERWTRGWLSVS